jgi:CDGSH-type Zn-finger protein/uncharacterized Fe-S cluster protein YjdI
MADAELSTPETAGKPGASRKDAAGSTSPRRYTSDAITVTWDAVKCIHAANCIAELPSVFDTHHRPWIDPSRAAASEVAAAVRACPSGALQYAVADAKAEIAPERPPALAQVEVQVDGPYYVSGDITLCDPGGVVLEDGARRLALCRCGATGNAPYCDNSHLAVKFANDPSGSEDSSGSAGGPQIRIQPDEPGPYHVCEGVRVIHPCGDVLAETGEVWLCRCGKSGSKPFCDGSHNQV